MSRTRAVLVGIDRYAAGLDWHLEGAALDACRMADWLVRRGLPADQITLLLAPATTSAPELARLGLPYRTPDRVTVYDVVTGELPQDPAEVLFVYWGGHGVVDGAGNRRLFYSDATTQDKRNLDFDALRAALASTFFPNLRRQIFVVDACQNLTDELRFLHTLPHESFPQGSHAHGREQHALFAASIGEAATNLDERRTGLFSSEVLEWLKRSEQGVEDLKVQDLADALDARFTTLRANGSSTQTPTYLWLKTPTREGFVYTLPPATSPSRLPMSSLRQLLDDLLTIDEIVDTPKRQRVILLMPPAIRAAVEYSDLPRHHILSWIRACEQFTTGRAAFVGALELGLSNREGLHRILSTVDHVWPAAPA